MIHQTLMMKEKYKNTKVNAKRTTKNTSSMENLAKNLLNISIPPVYELLFPEHIIARTDDLCQWFFERTFASHYVK